MPLSANYEQLFKYRTKPLLDFWDLACTMHMYVQAWGRAWIMCCYSCPKWLHPLTQVHSIWAHPISMRLYDSTVHRCPRTASIPSLGSPSKEEPSYANRKDSILAGQSINGETSVPFSSGTEILPKDSTDVRKHQQWNILLKKKKKHTPTLMVTFYLWMIRLWVVFFSSCVSVFPMFSTMNMFIYNRVGGKAKYWKVQKILWEKMMEQSW